MFCPKCGTQNADDIAICSSCGTELQQQQQPAQPVQMPVMAALKTSPLAIWSLVLSILGFCTCLLAIPGLILGILGLKQCNEKPDQFTGKGLAIAGIILSILAIFISFLLAAILFPVFNRARHEAQHAGCLSNVSQLGKAMMMYCDDYDKKYPPAAVWCDAVKKRVSDIDTMPPVRLKISRAFLCGSFSRKDCGFGFNRALGSISSEDITEPDWTVVTFESDNGWNANGSSVNMIAKPRHLQGFTIGFADGHAMSISQDKKSVLRWSVGN